MKVSQVMTRDAECTHPDATLRQAAERMRDLDVGSLPVCGDNDRLAGVITDRDIVVRAVAEGKDPNSARVEEAMTPEVLYCYEDQDVGEAAQSMKENQVRRLVVLNRDKRLVGIIALADVAVDTSNDRLTGDTVEAISQPSRPR